MNQAAFDAINYGAGVVLHYVKNGNTDGLFDQAQEVGGAIAQAKATGAGLTDDEVSMLDLTSVLLSDLMTEGQKGTVMDMGLMQSSLKSRVEPVVSWLQANAPTAPAPDSPPAAATPRGPARTAVPAAAPKWHVYLKWAGFAAAAILTAYLFWKARRK